MIGAVKGNTPYAVRPSFSQQGTDSVNTSFKQRYAEQVQQKNADRCELGNNDLQCFFENLNQQADGRTELTEEDIRELKQKYDLHNLTKEQKNALLLELNQRNVLSSQDCRNAKISLVPLSPESERRWDVSFDANERQCAFKPKNENGTTFVDGRSRTPVVYFQDSSQNICERYQDCERRWRSEYKRLLDEENREVPTCLEYADSYARLAKVFASLM